MKQNKSREQTLESAQYGLEISSNVGWQFPASFRKYFETNRIFSFALVYCDKMSTVASLGTKGEIKRQQIKFSDSELGRILKQMDSHTLYGIFRCSFINYDGPRTKVVNFFDE